MDSVISFLPLFLAQAGDLNATLGQYIGIISNIAAVVIFVALVLAGVMVTTGRTEYVKHALVGAMLVAAAWLIVTTMFGAAGISTGVQMQNVR